MKSYTLIINTEDSEYEDEYQAKDLNEALALALADLATMTKDKPTSFVIDGLLP